MQSRSPIAPALVHRQGRSAPSSPSPAPRLRNPALVPHPPYTYLLWMNFLISSRSPAPAVCRAASRSHLRTTPVQRTTLQCPLKAICTLVTRGSSRRAVAVPYAGLPPSLTSMRSSRLRFDVRVTVVPALVLVSDSQEESLLETDLPLRCPAVRDWEDVCICRRPQVRAEEVGRVGVGQKCRALPQTMRSSARVQRPAHQVSTLPRLSPASFLAPTRGPGLEPGQVWSLMRASR